MREDQGMYFRVFDTDVIGSCLAWSEGVREAAG